MEGMYWGDFRALIRRNKKPWRYMQYYRSKEGFIDTMSICDFSLPRRMGVVDTAEGHAADWYRDSFVCNAGYVNGYLPYRDNPSVWHEIKKDWVVRPMRGVKSTLSLLVLNKCIERTDEIRRLLL